MEHAVNKDCLKNVLASIPLAHSEKLSESYETLKLVFEQIKYLEHEWQICGDLNVIRLLPGQQKGYTTISVSIASGRADPGTNIGPVLPTRQNTSQHLCRSTTLPNNSAAHTTVHPRPTAAIRRKEKGKVRERKKATLNPRNKHPAANLHHSPDTIINYLIITVACNGIPKNSLS
jgi:hypothetical protein